MYIRINVKFLKIAVVLNFTRVATTTSVFLIMYSNKYNLGKAKSLETLDFTRVTSTMPVFLIM